LKNSIKIGKALCFALIFAGAGFATPVSDCGALRTANGLVVCNNGNPAQLRGMSLFWNQWSEGSQYYNANTISTLASGWKINVIRAAIGNGSTADAQTIIDAAISNGIYVIVDWHKYDIATEAAKTFFSTISNHVKGKGNPPNVIYEIFNEPTPENNGTWANIKTFANAVIPVIRANSPNNLIVVGTPEWSSRVDEAAADPLTGTNANNVAYTFHFYASEHGAAHRARVNTAYCKKLPMFITEWGTPRANGTGVINWTDVANWVNFIENRKLSHVNWSISSKYSAGETSSTTPSAESPSGQYVKDLISKLNSGKSHNDVKNDPYTCPGDIVIPPQEGGVVVGEAFQQEAENYVRLENSSAQKVSDNTALGGKMYLGPLNAGSVATYSLTAQKDTLIMLQIVVKSASGATIEISNGTYSAQGNIGAASSWSIVNIPVVLHKTGGITLTVKSGSINADYIAWCEFDKGNPLAVPPTIGDYQQFPEVAGWNLATPILSGKALKSFIANGVRGGVLLENIPVNSKVGIFDIKGNYVYRSEAFGERIYVPAVNGIYIVRVNNQTQKVVVK
jgi:hypothetical protein